MHNEREAIELYKKHEKEVKQRIVTDLLKVFDVEDMLYAVVWQLVCKCVKSDIPRERIKEIIYRKVDKELEKWIDV